MSELTPEIVAALKREHGEDLRAVRTSAGVIVFRKPTAAEWYRYQDALFADKAKVSNASREVQSACVVHPSADVWRAALDAQPALLTGSFGQAMNELAGVEEDAAPQKL